MKLWSSFRTNQDHSFRLVLATPPPPNPAPCVFIHHHFHLPCTPSCVGLPSSPPPPPLYITLFSQQPLQQLHVTSLTEGCVFAGHRSSFLNSQRRPGAPDLLVNKKKWKGVCRPLKECVCLFIRGPNFRSHRTSLPLKKLFCLHTWRNALFFLIYCPDFVFFILFSRIYIFFAN